MTEPEDPRGRRNTNTWASRFGSLVGVVFGLAMVPVLHADCSFMLSVRALLHWILGLAAVTLVLLGPPTLKLYWKGPDHANEGAPPQAARIVKVDDPMARLPNVARGLFLQRKLVWIQPNHPVDTEHIVSDDDEGTVLAVRPQDDFVAGDTIQVVYTYNETLGRTVPVYPPFQRYMAVFALRMLAWAVLGVVLATVALSLLFPGAPAVFASSEQVVAASERYFCSGNDDDDNDPCCHISTAAAWGYNLLANFPIVLLVGFTLHRSWMISQHVNASGTNVEPLV